MENETIQILEFLRPYYLDAIPHRCINPILLRFNHSVGQTHRLLRNLHAQGSHFIEATGQPHDWRNIGEQIFEGIDSLGVLKQNNFTEPPSYESVEIVVNARITKEGVEYLQDYYQYQGVLSTIDTNKNTKSTNSNLIKIFIVTALISLASLLVSIVNIYVTTETNKLHQQLKWQKKLLSQQRDLIEQYEYHH